MSRRRQRIAVSYPRDARSAERVEDVAAWARVHHRLGDATRRWHPHAARADDPDGRVPVLSLDDYSEIPYVETVAGLHWYQHRARIRCGEGDCLAVARAGIDGYEEYNREYLGLGRADTLQPASTGSGLALARLLARDRAAFGRLAAKAREAGGLLIHPYMAIEPVWDLARKLAWMASVPVRVLGPFPEVTRLVNDKARFSEVVERLLGPDGLVRTASSRDPLVVAERMREIAAHGEAVALKMPSSAAGMGNRVFESDEILGRPMRHVRGLVDRFLEEKAWDGDETPLVVEWHRDVIESPSAQCWIPPAGHGEPVVEGVFEQLLAGDHGAFEGAMPSGLPAGIRRELMIRSWLICRVFQRLGYVGRCSFDAVVVGSTVADARVKFVECNGRWGGTSTPMHLMKRVFGDFRARPYRGQGYADERLAGTSFRGLLEIFDGALYDRRTGRGRVLLYNVGGVTDHGRFDMVVTGRTYADIARFIQEEIPGRIGRATALPAPDR